MIILSLALSLVTPAHACAMPRFEEVVAQPTPDKKNADAAHVADAKEKAAPPKTLEQALADIDAAGIPELQNPAPAPAPAPAPLAQVD